MCNEQIAEWLALKEQINALNEKERAIRMKICEMVLDGKTEGSKTKVVDDVKLSATAILTYSVDRGELDIYQDELTDDDRAALDYKPVIKKRQYRTLPDDSRLRQCVTITPGMPQLKVV